MMDTPEYFECKCSHSGHILKFAYDKEGNEIYTEVQLVSCGFFQRIKNAIKYILKMHCRYGAWDCTILNNEDIPRLIKLLERTKKNEVSDRTD